LDTHFCHTVCCRLAQKLDVLSALPLMQRQQKVHQTLCRTLW